MRRHFHEGKIIYFVDIFVKFIPQSPAENMSALAQVMVC